MRLGSMATGVPREWMSTPAKDERTHGSWKRMRCDDVTLSYHRAARAVKHQSTDNLRDPLEECGGCRLVRCEVRSVLPRFATDHPPASRV
jgi:hypothetical protein